MGLFLLSNIRPLGGFFCALNYLFKERVIMMILKKKRTYVNPTMRIVQLEPTGNLMSVSNPEGSGEDMPWGRSRRLNDYWDLNYYDYED